jgi:hypothetical protein
VVHVVVDAFGAVVDAFGAVVDAFGAVVDAAVLGAVVDAAVVVGGVERGVGRKAGVSENWRDSDRANSGFVRGAGDCRMPISPSAAWTCCTPTESGISVIRNACTQQWLC